MRRLRVRLLLTFFSGMAAAALVGQIAGSARSLAAGRYDELSLFTSVLGLVRRNYFEPVDERRLLHGALRGMLRELDPHSAFMDVDAFKEAQVDTKGEFYGLGIEILKRKDGILEVVSPIDGTPAARAGLRPHDQIVAVCPTDPPEDWTSVCRSSKDMTLFEATQLLRGRRGTEITIEVLRAGFDRPKSYTLVRDVVKVVSVSGRMLEPGYAYLRLHIFQERTSQDLKRTLERLHEEAGAPWEGLILDLRDNPGGLVEQAVGVADAWLAEGLVVYTQGHVEAQRQEFRAHAVGTEPRYPIAVLVNEGTASSSEIVAGALQDQYRALVIGVTTFGKGSVQTVYPLEGGTGLRLTTALYYTPSGRSIQEVGIAPDIAVDSVRASRPAKGPTAPRSRSRERHREGDSLREGADPQTPAEGEDAETLQALGSDVQLDRALEILKGGTPFDRLKQDQEAGAEPVNADETLGFVIY